jgi:galactose mutarotase-like enzyme
MPTASSSKDLSVGRKVMAAGLDDDYTDLEFDQASQPPGLWAKMEWELRCGKKIYSSTPLSTQQTTSQRVRVISAVAIEPSTSEVNAFNSKQDLLLLEPNQTRSGSWGIKLLK